jgi:hypothetical protein
MAQARRISGPLERLRIVGRREHFYQWLAALQTEEQHTMRSLPRSLCDGIVTPAYPGRGPKPRAYSDAIFGMVAKDHSGRSARRAAGVIRACAEEGHISRAPSYNSVIASFDKPEFTGGDVPTARDLPALPPTVEAGRSHVSANGCPVASTATACRSSRHVRQSPFPASQGRHGRGYVGPLARLVQPQSFWLNRRCFR